MTTKNEKKNKFCFNLNSDKRGTDKTRLAGFFALVNFDITILS